MSQSFQLIFKNNGQFKILWVPSSSGQWLLASFLSHSNLQKISMFPVTVRSYFRFFSLLYFALIWKIKTLHPKIPFEVASFQTQSDQDSLHLYKQHRTTNSLWELAVVYLQPYTVSKLIADHRSAYTLSAHSQRLKQKLTNWSDLLSHEVSPD